MSVIGLFPGQGAQYVGMLLHSLSLPSVQRICKLASDILGYDLADICRFGPQSKLNQTVYCQPATLLASLCSYEKYIQTNNPPNVMAGFSVGEISALAVSNSISHEDAFQFVKHRAEAMQLASESNPSKMLSVTGLNTDTVQSVLDEFNAGNNTKYLAVIANFLSDATCSISVARNEAERLIERLNRVGARSVKCIPVSGGFHSQFMSQATEAIRSIAEQIEISLPSVPTYSNLTAKPYASVEEIRNSLVSQMTFPVQWFGIIKRIIGCYPNPKFVELGYGNQLLSILARIDRKAFKIAAHIAP